MIYPFSVSPTTVEGHHFWVAESACLKGCVGQGDTAQEAIDELAVNEQQWLLTAEELEIPIPDVPVKNPAQFSGKFTVRVSPLVHKQTAERAKAYAVSLNQYVSDAIIEKNTKADLCEQLCAIVSSAQGNWLENAALASVNTIWRLSNYFSQLSSGNRYVENPNGDPLMGH